MALSRAQISLDPEAPNYSLAGIALGIRKFVHDEGFAVALSALRLLC